MTVFFGMLPSRSVPLALAGQNEHRLRADPFRRLQVATESPMHGTPFMSTPKRTPISFSIPMFGFRHSQCESAVWGQ
jgi:hypothetical protein